MCKLLWNSASRSWIHERGNVFRFYSQDTVCFSQWEDWRAIRNSPVEPAPVCFLLAPQQLFCGYYRVLLFFVSAPSKYKVLYSSPTTGICLLHTTQRHQSLAWSYFSQSLTFVIPSFPISKLRITKYTWLPVDFSGVELGARCCLRNCLWPEVAHPDASQPGWATLALVALHQGWQQPELLHQPQEELLHPPSEL